MSRDHKTEAYAKSTPLNSFQLFQSWLQIGMQNATYSIIYLIVDVYNNKSVDGYVHPTIHPRQILRSWCDVCTLLLIKLKCEFHIDIWNQKYNTYIFELHRFLTMFVVYEYFKNRNFRVKATDFAGDVSNPRSS